jgi:hypothetical protein
VDNMKKMGKIYFGLPRLSVSEVTKAWIVSKSHWFNLNKYNNMLRSVIGDYFHNDFIEGNCYKQNDSNLSEVSEIWLKGIRQF